MAHVTRVGPEEELKISAHPGVGAARIPLFATVFVDDSLLVRVQRSHDDTTALTATTSLTSDYVRLFEHKRDNTMVPWGILLSRVR